MDYDFGGGLDYSYDPNYVAGDFTDQNMLAGLGIEQPTQWDASGGISNYTYDTPYDAPMDTQYLTGNTAPAGSDYYTSNLNIPAMNVPSYQPGDVASPISAANPANGITNPAPANTPSGAFAELGQAYNQFKDKPISSTLDVLGSKPGLAILGMGANLYGNTLQQKATQKGQQNYLNAVQWTPEKTENYMNALRNNVTSLYGNAAQGQNKAMAASNAARGRGGGTYGNQTQAVSREMRENMARALNQGALTTNTPVNPGMGAYAQTSPVGQTLTGIGGDLASINNSSMQMDYLRKLGIIK